MKLITTALFLIIATALSAQATISGKITDAKGTPVPAANVYIDGTYDGFHIKRGW
jgi:protocatechuate 3,4-dioxygenase beta subunit